MIVKRRIRNIYIVWVVREQEADMIAHQTQVVNTVGQLHSDVSSLKVEYIYFWEILLYLISG